MEYQWIKNKRYKNVSIRIKEGQIIVTSPVQTSKEFVDTFVNQHTHWIQKQLAAYEAIPRIRPGMTLFILERPYKVVMGDVCAINLDKETLANSLKRDCPKSNHAAFSSVGTGHGLFEFDDSLWLLCIQVGKLSKGYGCDCT